MVASLTKERQITVLLSPTFTYQKKIVTQWLETTSTKEHPFYNHINMKLIHLWLLIIFSFSVSSCEIDETDSPACTQNDFIGVFEGGEDCGGGPEDVTYTLTADGANAVKINFRFEDGTSLTTADPVRLNGCKFTFGDSELTVDGTLNGDVLTVVATREDGSCTSTLTRN